MLGLRTSVESGEELLNSRLLDQDNFYATFEKDLAKATREVIIESPFISSRRLNHLLPTLRQLAYRRVHIVINTKPVEEQDPEYVGQTEECLRRLQEIGAEILITGGHHRKFAIIDRQILYEGSLNILSQSDSCEIMRRIHSSQASLQMIDFIGIDKFIG